MAIILFFSIIYSFVRLNPAGGSHGEKKPVFQTGQFCYTDRKSKKTTGLHPAWQDITICIANIRLKDQAKHPVVYHCYLIQQKIPSAFTECTSTDEYIFSSLRLRLAFDSNGGVKNPFGTYSVFTKKSVRGYSFSI